MMPTNMMGGASRPNISVGPEISSNIFSHAMLTSRTAIMMMMQTDFRNLDSPDFKKSIFQKVHIWTRGSLEPQLRVEGLLGLLVLSVINCAESTCPHHRADTPACCHPPLACLSPHRWFWTTGAFSKKFSQSQPISRAVP
jgi:hypothetical protein